MDSRLQILVVDDDPEILQGTCRLLNKAGYLTAQAQNGAEALGSLRASQPHLVLLDRHLPDTDGLKICQEIKSDPSCSSVCVLLVSGIHVESEDEIAGLEKGADGYIVRPISNAELLARVKAFARIARLNRQLAEEVEQRRRLDEELEKRVELRTQQLVEANEELREAHKTALQLIAKENLARDRVAAANEKLREEIFERRRVEEELRRSEAHFRGYFELGLIGMAITSLEKNWVQFNDRLCEILGYPREELQRKSWAELTHPDDLQRDTDDFDRVLRGEKDAYALEKRFRRGDGQIIHAEISVKCVRGSDGSVDHFVAMVQDITQRKRAEEDLRKSEARFRSLFKEMAQGVFYQGADGRLLDANDAALDLFGLTREQFLDRTDLDPRWRVLREDGRDFPGAEYPSTLALRTGKSVRGTVAGVFRPKTNDYAWLVINAVPQFEPGRKDPHEVFVTLHDITMLRRAEEQLRESMQTSADIVAAIPSGLFIYQFEPPDRLVLLSGNPEAEHLTGLTIHQWKGREFNEIWPEAAHRGLLDHYLKVMQTGEMYETEDLYYSDERLSGAFRIRAFAVPKNRLAVAFENITLRRQAEEERERLQSQLLQAQKMESIGQLAGGVAHDFNNILAAMLMNLSFARRLPEISSVAHEILEELEKEAKRAADLTRQLLLFSRRSVMQKRQVDLSSLIGNMIKMLRRVIGEHITLETEAAGPPVWVEADTGMIEQVIMNLTVNARDAMPRGGQLAIKTSQVNIDRDQATRFAEAQGGSYACLSVSDSGCGMDKATIEKIFDPFFTTKDVGHGTGLGLSTVDGIVRQHKGWIEVESTPGKGSLFRIYLPLLHAATSQESKAEPPKETAPGHETILLVEDNPSVRRALTKLLLQSGYKVREAGTGSQGLRGWQALEGKVDLLFTDMMLPEGMSGLDLAEVLRTRKPGLKVIVHSGYDAELLSKSRNTCPGITYVPKPIDPSLLLKAIRDRLDAKE